MHNTYLPPADKSIPISIPDQAQRRSSVTSSEFFNSTLDDEAYESVDSVSTTSSSINTTTSSDYLEPVTRSVGTSTSMENRGGKQVEKGEENAVPKQASKKTALVILVVFLILAAFGVGFGVCVALKINAVSVPSCSAESATVCPYGFLTVKNATRTWCYAVISQPKTWYDSYQACITKNPKAHLVTVDDAEENSLLRVPFQSVTDAERHVCTDNATQTWYWTAGQTLNGQTRNLGVFFWSYMDESGRVERSVPITYANWWRNAGPYIDPTWSWPSILIAGGPEAPLDSYLKMGVNPAYGTRCALCEIDIQ